MLPSPSRSIVNPVLEAGAVFVGYLLAAVLATWPLARDPLSGFYGFPNDNYGGIWLTGFLHDAYHGPASAGLAPNIQAPFGLEIGQQGLQPLDRLMAYLFGGPGDGLAAYNLQIFASFVLAGCTMYLLARYVTGNLAASALAGLIYAFSPFHLAQAMQYPALSSIQWIPLYVLALLVLLQRGRWRDAALTGGAFALVTLTSYYHAWFMAWATVGILVVFIVGRARAERRANGRISLAASRRFVSNVMTRGGLAIAVAVLIAFPLVRSSASTLGEPGVGTRPIEEAVRYSARPWMMLLPPHDNPVFGDLTRGLVQNHLYEAPIYEQSLYIGYAVLLLVCVALWRPWRHLDSLDRIRFTRPLAVTGAVMGIAIMIGPYFPLGGDYWRLWSTPGETAHVPFLGSAMFEVASVFRFFSRGFVVLSVCLAILAAVGLARLHQRLGGHWARLAVTVAAFIVVALEFANAPPHVFAKEVDPIWLKAVAALPTDATIVQYPLAPVNSSRSLYYLYWQRRHDRATVNPAQQPRAETLEAQIRDPNDPSTGKALLAAGVDVVVIHTSLPPLTTPPYQPSVPTDALPAATGSLNPWFEKIRNTADAILYRVRVTPRVVEGAFVTFGDGWGPPERRRSGSARWMIGSEGSFVVVVSGRRRSYELRLVAGSFAQPRVITAHLDGAEIGRYRVRASGLSRLRLELGQISGGAHKVTLTPNPPGESIGARLGTTDTRLVSFEVADPPVLLPR